MQNKVIYAVTDYNELFGSKHNAVPYKSGMDKTKLAKCFLELDYKLEYVRPIDIDFSENWFGKNVIYSSQEDISFVYKDFLEDVVFGLEQKGANVIPKYAHLRANNNKVFMHILEDIFLSDINKILPTKRFSTLTELSCLDNINYPVVIKLAAGAMSQNVALARNYKELVSFVKNNSVSVSTWDRFKELVREKKYDGYKPQDNVKNKFVIQDFLPGLESDYKVLKFGEYFYIFKRPVRENDFRASGSGQVNYLYGSDCDVPDGIFELVEKIANAIDTPTLSVDIAASSKGLYVIEFQSIYFGTVGQHRSDVVFVKTKNEFIKSVNTFSLEELYARSIVASLRSSM